MNATLTTNGKPRKQLSDQLDRFDEQLARQDSILDALADGLNAAVADAAREGVKEAVKIAIVEMMTSSDLRTALHQATAPPKETKPSAWARLKALVRAGAAKVKQAVIATGMVVAAKAKVIHSSVTGTTGLAALAWRFRNVLLVGLGVGLATAGLSYVATHGVSAALSGIGAAATAVALQAKAWFRKTVHRLAPA